MRQIDEGARARAAEIIRILRNPPHLPDEEVGAPLAELGRILGHPRMLDLIFHQNPDLSDDEIIDTALDGLAPKPV